MTAEEIKPTLALRLVGLTEGEGCFYIAHQGNGNYNCGFTIKMRADDRRLLEHSQAGCGGIGSITEQPRTNGWAPTVSWQVRKKADVGVIRDLFELYPLWSKKSRDFAIWAEAADFWLHCVGYGTDWTPVADAKRRLHEIKVYEPVPQ